MSKYHLLIDKFIGGSISPDERKDLERWVLENKVNLAFFEKSLKQHYPGAAVDFDTELAYRRFLETLKSKKRASKPLHTILRYAAVFVLLFAVGFLSRQLLLPSNSKTLIKVAENEINSGKEITIKLADGTTKVLNSEEDGLITDAAGNIVANKDGSSLTFDMDRGSAKTTTMYNEVFIPYGQTFKLKLSDGTLVWLNAGSKLRFPHNFTGSDKNRIVNLEGEAFFEVTENKEKPFIVNTQEIDVKVLGTKFNISSYKTDNSIVTTLVEGSVEVYKTKASDIVMQLTPGFQADYNIVDNSFNKKKVDPSRYTAWTKNLLVIENLKFPEILIKLERKYAVKFINNAKGMNNEVFKGEFGDENIESVLKTMSLSRSFNYEINQNVITLTE